VQKWGTSFSIRRLARSAKSSVLSIPWNVSCSMARISRGSTNCSVIGAGICSVASAAREVSPMPRMGLTVTTASETVSPAVAIARTAEASLSFLTASSSDWTASLFADRPRGRTSPFRPCSAS